VGTKKNDHEAESSKVLKNDKYVEHKRINNQLKHRRPNKNKRRYQGETHQYHQSN